MKTTKHEPDCNIKIIKDVALMATRRALISYELGMLADNPVNQLIDELIKIQQEFDIFAKEQMKLKSKKRKAKPSRRSPRK
jgi:hypothetical protein